jgi:hypothetical protein
MPSRAASADNAAQTDVPAPPDAGGTAPTAPPPPPPQAPQPTGWLARWLDKLPFIPVPEIAADPDSGTTLGVLPVWLVSDEDHHISRIIAPDVFHTPYFGYGFHARIYDYPSEDEQWSVVAGLKQQVEREFDAEYQIGRLRTRRWSFSSSLIYDRSGVPRFYGIGNATTHFNQTNYTNQQALAQVQVGLNISRAWQLLYTLMLHSVDVLPGTLNIPSIETRFPNVRGLGTTHELLNRFSVVYDSRDDFTAPRRGQKWVVYGGLSSRGGAFNDTLYSEAGLDGRGFWPILSRTVLAAHVSLRYLPSTTRLPFWALSSIGGGESDIGGQQPLRGFGAGRYYDRNSFSTSAELRRAVASFDAMSSHVELEVAPFVDLGRVYGRTGLWPARQLHKVAGVGFRGIARPSVVGYVDVGYGSEGAAVFTGINYPF